LVIREEGSKCFIPKPREAAREVIGENNCKIKKGL
jgi:hypothetical protein